MEKQIKSCPFCGCIPEVNGDVVTHRHKDDICIVDDTQYNIEKWNKRADGWISVKDRLPNDIFEYVLAYDKYEDIIFARYCNDWQNKDEFFNDVTHWMPLPEAPK